MNNLVKFPLIENEEFLKGNELYIRRKLDLAYDLYLENHIVKGNYVFPAVYYLEMFLEMAVFFSENIDDGRYDYYYIRELDLKSFIKCFPQNELIIKGRVTIKERKKGAQIYDCSLYSDFTNSSGQKLIKNRHHASCFITLFENSYLNPEIYPIDIQEVLKNGRVLNLEKFYQQINHAVCFGDMFRKLSLVVKINEDVYFGMLRALKEEEAFESYGTEQLILSPITLDCIGRVPMIGIFNQSGWVCIPINLKHIKIQRTIREKELLYTKAHILKMEGDEIMVKQKIYDESGCRICELELIFKTIDRMNDYIL